MTDIDYGAVFGVEDTTGAEVTEPAEPSESTENSAGAEVQEPAEPAVDGTRAATRVAPTDSGAQAGTEENPEPERTERDAQFAAARRKAEAERDAAIARARQDAQAEAQRTIDQFFANSGLINPYTRQPIQSKAEYEAYRERFEAERKQELMRKSGMSPEEYQTYINDLPEVRAARQAREAAEKAAKELRQREAKAKIEEQMKEIQQLDPSVKDIRDLSRMETYPKLYDLVRRGYSISDAYKLANYDALTARKAEASKQAVINAAKSKEHLSSTKSRGSGAVSVPADVAADYRLWNPEMTDEEIQKDYQKYLKSKERS